MCCFSGAVDHVGGTKIFANVLPDGSQALIYSMEVRAPEDLAMILPLPVPPGSPEDAVRFVDLSGYSRFFANLADAFRGPVLRSAREDMVLGAPLAVHVVGAFEASFVPSLGDFGRLDPRFRLAPEVWRSLPQYADWGFAVFKLCPSEEIQDVHPMAFTFPRRDASRVFFPTVHVHDGVVREVADFDHELYMQMQAPGTPSRPWRRAFGPVSEYVDIRKTKGLMNRADAVWNRSIRGTHENKDIFVVA
jgi:hypothetical protein